MKKVSLALIIVGGGLAGCQPYYVAPPVAQGYAPQGNWVYQPAVTYRQPEVVRTEITVPAYVDRYGRVVSVDYNNGWVGQGGYGRQLVAVPR